MQITHSSRGDKSERLYSISFTSANPNTIAFTSIIDPILQNNYHLFLLSFFPKEINENLRSKSQIFRQTD